MNRLTHPDRARLHTLLEEYLATYPDMRFGQAVAAVLPRRPHQETIDTLYYIEDGVLVERLESLLGRGGK